MPPGAAIQPSRAAARSSRSGRTPSLMLDPVSTACSAPSRRAPSGQPETCGPQGAEDHRREEHDPVRAHDIVDDTSEPWADRATEAVAEIERAVDHAEASAAEEVGRHRGDDRAAGAEAEPEEERVGDQPAGARIGLQRQQRQRAPGGAPERRRRRESTAEPVRRQAEADDDRHEAHHPEDGRRQQRLKAAVDCERDLVGGYGEDGERREEVCEPEGPERARSERVPQRRINSPAGPLAPVLARRRPRSFIVAWLWISSADRDDRDEDAQGARTQNSARDAPAQGRNQPLSQRAGHEHPEAHAGKGYADRSPAPLREPAREEHAHGYRAEADEPCGGEHARVKVELPRSADRRAQERRAGQEHGPGEDHAPRPDPVDQDSRDRCEQALYDRRQRQSPGGQPTRPAEFLDERDEEYREGKGETD